MLLNALFVGSWVIYPRIKKQEVSVVQMTLVSLGFWVVTAILMTALLSELLDIFWVGRERLDYFHC